MGIAATDRRRHQAAYQEDFIPEKADRWIFFFAPYIAVASAFIVFAVIPFGPDWAVITDVNIGLLFVLAVSSVLGAGADSGWLVLEFEVRLLGGLRSSAQMVSYEVAMGLSLIGALMFARTFRSRASSMRRRSDSIWFSSINRRAFCCFWLAASRKTIARRLICLKPNRNS